MGQLQISSMLTAPNTQAYLQKILGEKKEQFVQACISAVSQNQMLQNCDPASVMTAAISATTLNLSTDPNMGEAYLIPYGNKCQLQIGTQGFFQLCNRTGLYQKINVTDVREGELKMNRLTGDITLLDVEDRDNKPVVGYVAYYRLLSGQEHSLYMTVQQLQEHRKRYSKPSRNGKPGLWDTDFDKMCEKTVLKLLLKKWGVRSTELRNAVMYDQAVLTPNFKKNTIDVNYIDNPNNETSAGRKSEIFAESIVAETEEVKEEGNEG